MSQFPVFGDTQRPAGPSVILGSQCLAAFLLLRPHDACGALSPTAPSCRIARPHLPGPGKPSPPAEQSAASSLKKQRGKVASKQPPKPPRSEPQEVEDKEEKRDDGTDEEEDENEEEDEDAFLARMMASHARVREVGKGMGVSQQHQDMEGEEEEEEPSGRGCEGEGAVKEQQQQQEEEDEGDDEDAMLARMLRPQRAPPGGCGDDGVRPRDSTESKAQTAAPAEEADGKEPSVMNYESASGDHDDGGMAGAMPTSTSVPLQRKGRDQAKVQRPAAGRKPGQEKGHRGDGGGGSVVVTPAAPIAAEDDEDGNPLAKRDKRKQKLAARKAAATAPGPGQLGCTGCGLLFASRNQLFKHITETGHAALKG